METLFTYFIKVSVLVSLFYLSYYFLLKKETFFNKSRWFLLAGLITSVVLPFITITKTVWIEPELIVFQEPVFISDFSQKIILNGITEKQPQKTEINWSQLVAGFYLLGALFFLIKLVLSSLSLYKILHKAPITKQNGYKFVDSKNVKTPFSFFNYIAFDSSAFSSEELQNIIAHEKVHSKQKHSLDVLLSEVFSVVFWFHPFVWLYKKVMLQNLEFIADSKAIKIIENRVNYQKTLLKITINPKDLALANPFFQPLIKKRIIMLNKKQSKKVNIIKYAFVLPILVVFVMQFQTKVVAQTKENKKQTNFSQEHNNSEKGYKLPEIKEWKYADDILIIEDTIVWFKNVTKNPNDYINQSTGDRVTIKSNSWEDVRRILENNTSETMEKDSIREKFILQTGSWEEVEDILKNKELTSQRMGGNPLIIVNGKEVEKKDILSFETKGITTYYDKESAIKKFGNKAKDGAIIIEGKIINIEDTKNRLKENEERLKQRESQLREREKQARERSGLSDEEIQKRIQERQKMLEERRKELEEKNIERKELYDKSKISVIIDKNTSDKQIQEFITLFKSSNIEMKVSNIKRNKNGEIIKIKISVSEISGDKNNKKESKATTTFDKKNKTIPNIFIGKQFGNLVIENYYIDL